MINELISNSIQKEILDLNKLNLENTFDKKDIVNSFNEIKECNYKDCVEEKLKEYKDDNGEIYRLGNELLPYNNYEINGYKYETDELGRVTSAEGYLHLKEREGRLPIKDSMEVVGKGYELPTDDRGHIIGDLFDGSNGLENLIPQDAVINRKDFQCFEKQLAEEVKNGKKVYFINEPKFEDLSRRPKELIISYTIDGRENMRIFPNGKDIKE